MMTIPLVPEFPFLPSLPDEFCYDGSGRLKEAGEAFSHTLQPFKILNSFGSVVFIANELTDG